MSSNTVAISVRGLGKEYTIAHNSTRPTSLREAIIQRLRHPFGNGQQEREAFWALRDVAFEVQPGEVVGIIGRNGAGKSTLLKILSRITVPTTGEIDIHGRLGSLLEVATGFHPELTGRENIFLNGAILGMHRSKIVRNFDEIVDFAGVEKFLDTPVKRYSSGMYVRLAFAVAAFLETDVLLVDEVLAVGDVEFQRKCLGRMQDLSSGGRTIFFVSHSMLAMRSLTQRCLYLQNGRLSFDGKTPEAIDRYLEDAWTRKSGDDRNVLDYYRRDRSDGRAVQFHRVWVTNSDGIETEALRHAEDFTVHCELDSFYYKGDVVLSFHLTNHSSERVATFHSRDQGFDIALTPGQIVISATVQHLPLSPGRYNLTLGVNQNSITTAFDVLVDYPAFTVSMTGVESGEYDWPHRPWGVIHWREIQWSAP